MKKRKENAYRKFVRYTMLRHGFVFWEIPDGFNEVNGQRISQERHVDMHGIYTRNEGTGLNFVGKYVGCELKIADHPTTSMLESSQHLYLAEVERMGGIAFVCCIQPEEFTMSLFGYAGGEFRPITSWQKVPMKKEI